MRMNPFTLKELRQLTRTKSIAVSLVMFLFASLITVYLITQFETVGAAQMGSMMFNGVVVLLAFALCLVLPSEVYNRMERELGSGKERADLIMLTALPPSEVIDGKLRGAFALMALFASASLPFGVLSYLMHGITFATMLRMVVAVLCASCIVVHVVLAIATLRASRLARRCIYWLFIIVVAINAMFASTAMLAFATDLFADSAVLMLFLFASLTVCMVLRGCAISSFAPVVMERDMPLRLAIIASIVGWFVYAHFFAGTWTAESGWLGLSELAALLLAAGAVAQRPGTSRRIVAARPKNKYLRILHWPFSSVAANGMAFACIIAFAVNAVRPALFDGTCSLGVAGDWKDFIVLLYAFALLFTVRWIWRLFFARSVSPVVLPTFAVALFAVMQSIPSLIAQESAITPELQDMPFYCSGITANPSLHMKQAFIAFAVAVALNIVTSLVRQRRTRQS